MYEVVNVWGGECLGGERLTIVFFGRMQSVLADIKFYVPPSVESLYVTPRKSLFVGFCRTFSAAAQLR